MNLLGTILQRRRYLSTLQWMTASRARLAWLNTLWAVLRKTKGNRSWQRCHESLLAILDPRKSVWKDVSAQNSKWKVYRTVLLALKEHAEDSLWLIASIVISSRQHIKHLLRLKVEPQSCQETEKAMNISSSQEIWKIHNIHLNLWGLRRAAN